MPALTSPGKPPPATPGTADAPTAQTGRKSTMCWQISRLRANTGPPTRSPATNRGMREPAWPIWAVDEANVRPYVPSLDCRDAFRSRLALMHTHEGCCSCCSTRSRSATPGRRRSTWSRRALPVAGPSIVAASGRRQPEPRDPTRYASSAVTVIRHPPDVASKADRPDPRTRPASRCPDSSTLQPGPTQGLRRISLRGAGP
jgi:hypothetical protein